MSQDSLSETERYMIDNINNEKGDQKWFPCYFDYNKLEKEDEEESEEIKNLALIQDTQNNIWTTIKNVLDKLNDLDKDDKEFMRAESSQAFTLRSV